MITNGTLCVSLITVILFAAMQVLFFVLIASEEVPRYGTQKVEDFMNILRGALIQNGYHHTARELDQETKMVCENMKEEDVNKMRSTRWKKNRAVLLQQLWLPFSVLIVLLVLCVGYGVWNKQHTGVPVFSPSDRFSLFLVAPAYITEILFFLLVVSRWEHIGSYEILSSVTRSSVQWEEAA